MNRKALLFFLPLLLNAALAPVHSPTASAFNTAHLALLKAGVESWNSMRSAHQEFLPDLSGAELKGKKLKGADLHNAILSGADLSQTDLSHANLQNALLDSANMSCTILFKANLQGALLRGADLESAQLDGANLHRAVLETAVLKKADCSNADMRESNLRESNLRETTLVNANLSGADLRAAYLWRANLSRANMTGVKVSEKSVLDNGKYATLLWAQNHQSFFFEEAAPSLSAGVVSSDLTQKDGQPIVPLQPEAAHSPAQRLAGSSVPQRDATASKKSFTFRNIWQQSDGPARVAYDREQYEQIKGDVFKMNKMRKGNRDIRINLIGASFDHKNLSYADLSHALLRYASFKAGDLGDSDLRYADLRGCDFRETNLQHADLGGADLRGANLWRANLSRARLTEAIVTSSTILDSGKKATPELALRHGLIFVEQ